MPEYIERGTAIKRVMETKWESGSDGAAAMEIVAAAPTADVAPVVHGRFVHRGPRFVGGVDWWNCSICGSLVSGVEIRFSYCPNCGAKMDGGAVDE